MFSPLFTASCQKAQFYLHTKSHAGRQPLRRNRHLAVFDSSSTLPGITKGLFPEIEIVFFFCSRSKNASFCVSLSEIWKCNARGNNVSFAKHVKSATAEMSALCSGLVDLLLFISDSINPFSTPFPMFYLLAFCVPEHKKKKNSLAVSVRRSAIRSCRSAMENNNGKWTDFLPSPNYSEDLSRTPCQRWPRTDPIWPLAHTRQLLVLVPVKRRSMRHALIVIISDRLPGTISNPHHLSCRQVHRHGGDPWLLLL